MIFANRLRLAAFVGVCGVLGIALDSACIIAEPPSELPTLPPRRPTIIRDSVVPVAGSVLTRFPAKFIVPVELYDRRVTVFWNAFIDYNPATGTGLDFGSSSEFEPGSSQTDNVRLLEIPITTPSSDRCHTIEIVVALSFPVSVDSRGAHTPGEPGGDSVSWFYNPTSADPLAGCPVLDAGLIPVVEDAGAEAGGTVP